MLLSLIFVAELLYNADCILPLLEADHVQIAIVILAEADDSSVANLLALVSECAALLPALDNAGHRAIMYVEQVSAFMGFIVKATINENLTGIQNRN